MGLVARCVCHALGNLVVKTERRLEHRWAAISHATMHAACAQAVSPLGQPAVGTPRGAGPQGQILLRAIAWREAESGRVH
jgi:predicted NodU family carbamoyl transferase